MPSPPANVKKWYLNGKKAPAKLTDDLVKLERDIGLLTTQEQFEKAMNWRETGKTGADDIFRHEVWKAYNETQNYHDESFVTRVADKYALFELFDQLPQYFLPGVTIDDDYTGELACLGKMYIAIAGRNSLALLDDPFEGDSIADSGGTCAEKFRAHLERFENERGFESWTIEHLQSARPAIYKALKDSRGQRGRTASSEGQTNRANTARPTNGNSSGLITRSQAANTNGVPVDGTDADPEPIIASNSRLQRANIGTPRNDNAEEGGNLQTATSNPSPELDELTEEIEEQVDALKGLLGDLKESKQIIRASKKLDTIHDKGSDSDEAKAFRIFLDSNENIDQQVMHWEINLYRLTGETAATITNNDYVTERFMLHHLRLLAQSWASLSASGELGELGNSSTVKEARQKGRSLGQVLNAYLADYQRQKGIKEWSESDISAARRRVVDVWNKVHAQRREKKHGVSEGANTPSPLKKIKIWKARRPQNGGSTPSTVNNDVKPLSGIAIPDLYGRD